MGSLKGKRALLVIASDQFRDEEYEKPRAILEGAGVDVVVACSSLDESTGMLGMKVKPDVLIEEAIQDNFDALVLVGGMGSTEYWDSPVAHQLAQKQFFADKVTSAICLAPMTLANAGLLQDKKATIWQDVKDDFASKGVNYTGADVEQDGLIITGSGPDAAEAFGQALVKALQSN